MLVGRGEDVEDAAAHRELPAPGDHVDARVGEVDESRREVGEVVAAVADRERDGLELGETRSERLQCGAHRGDNDDRMPRAILKPIRLPVAQPAQGPDALAHRLGARAQTLVRERLPCGELEDLGIRNEARHRVAQRLGVAPRRHDREERLGTLARTKERREKRCAQPVDEGEIRAVMGVLDGVFERAGVQKPGT